MKIVGYLRTSLIEWPGKVSGVIFTPRCNFRCPFCHNADLVEPKRVAKQDLIPEDVVLADLKERKKWIDGVVITGGEPTLQKDLKKFLEKLKKIGFEVMIETNGSQPEILAELLEPSLINFIGLDFKTEFSRKYSQVVGLKKFNSKIVEESLKLLLKSKILFELRTTVVPGIHDKKTLVKMARQLKKVGGRRKIPWCWQNFQPKNCLDLSFEKKKPYKKEKLGEFLKAARKYYPNVELRRD